MFNVHCDKERQVLRVQFSEHVTSDEAKACVDEVEACLTEMKAGFRLLTDMSKLNSMDLGCKAHIARSMDLCSAKSISTVVRVIPDPHKDIGFNILSYFHYGSDVRLVTCDSVDEAQEVLSQP